METKVRQQLPKVKKGTLSIYTPAQIKSAGSVEKFLEEIAVKNPIKIPDLGCSEEKWDKMEELIRNDS